MAEFYTANGDFTHGTLVDGRTAVLPVGGGNVKMGRFGPLCYYQFRTSGVFRCHIAVQSATEVRLVFVIKGRGVRTGCVGELCSFSAGESNGLLVRGGDRQYVASEENEDCEFLLLAVDRSGILSSAAEGQPRFRKFLHGGRSTWLLRGPNMVLGMRKIGVIQQLLYDQKPVYLQAMYTQMKLTELLVLFLEKADGLARNGVVPGLRAEDLERMQQVRDLLHNEPAETYSLVGLAHTVGTNEASLKKNFKAVYGTTVFGYLTARRMELAKQLLLEKELKVSAVAQEVGYKYASHFTAAFRKHFGILPTQLLRVLMPVLLILGDIEVGGVLPIA